MCLSYTYNFEDKKYQEYVSVLSILSQVSIDSAKRAFAVNIGKEIKRIKKDVNIKENGYPLFWKAIRRDQSDLVNKELKCPMNCIYNINLPSYKPNDSTIPIREFFIGECDEQIRKCSKKIEELIERYSIDLYNYNIENSNTEEYLLLREDFEKMISEIKQITLGKKYKAIFYWLLNRAFMITPAIKRNDNAINTNLSRNKVLLMKTLYEVNKDVFLSIFCQNGFKMGTPSDF